MNRHSFRHVGAAITVALALFTGAQHGVAEDRPIHALIAEQTAAWNQRDANAWARDFAADADFINILGMRFQGRNQIELRHAFLFSGIFKESRLSVTVDKVRPLGDHAAVVDTVHELKGYLALPPGIRPTDTSGTLSTRMRYVVTRSGSGQWQIVSAQNTAISPSNSPAGSLP